MKSNKKNYCDNFANIAREIREGGLNVKQWAKHNGLSLTTVRYALAGYPQTENAARIRAAARAAVKRIGEDRAELLNEVGRIFAK